MVRKDPAMDEPSTRKPEVTDDRADPAERSGWYFGPDAVDLLRRALWGAAGVGLLGLLLVGAGVWYLRDALGILRDIVVALKTGR